MPISSEQRKLHRHRVRRHVLHRSWWSEQPVQRSQSLMMPDRHRPIHTFTGTARHSAALASDTSSQAGCVVPIRPNRQSTPHSRSHLLLDASASALLLDMQRSPSTSPNSHTKDRARPARTSPCSFLHLTNPMLARSSRHRSHPTTTLPQPRRPGSKSSQGHSPRPTLPTDTTDFGRVHLAGHQNRPNSDIVRKQPIAAQPITATHERLKVSQLTNIR